MCHRREPDYSINTYLGIHLGSRRMYGVILDASLKEKFNAIVHYDVDVPEFDTLNGYCISPKTKELTVDPVMYIKSLDILINCLKGRGANLNNVVAISVTAHDLGCIYWSDFGFRRLCGLNPLSRLHHNFTQSSFTICPSPIVKYGSTSSQCRNLEELVGGRQQMINITGSKCDSKMIGVQISKVYEEQTAEYEKTVHISLMSSFLTSLLIGSIASIDFSDGSFMNLLDLNTKSWSHECLEACADRLSKRLMKPIASNRLQGRVADYYVRRWNFRSDCMVVAATNKNCSIMSTLRPDSDYMVISLGGSDKIIMNFKTRPHMEMGVLLCHPTRPNEYLGFLSFNNGGQIRDALCEELADGDWSVFNEMLDSTPMGNQGKIMIRFDHLETLSESIGTLRWDKDINALSEVAYIGVPPFEAQFEARALIEGQIMHHKIVATNAGYTFGKDMKLIAIGRGSHNSSLLQIMADVYNTPVYTHTSSTPFVLGAAYRARYAFYEHREVNCNCERCRMRRARKPRLSFDEFFQCLPEDTIQLKANPTPHCEKIYKPLMERFSTMSRIQLNNI